jgi:hypothetical protein
LPCAVNPAPSEKSTSASFLESDFQLFNNSIASSKDETLFLLTAILLGFHVACAEASRQGWDCRNAIDRLGRWIEDNGTLSHLSQEGATA